MQRMRLSSALLAVLLPAILGGCSGVTKIKYAYHFAAEHVRLPDGSTVTAPAGKHYGLFLINCVDNSTRRDGFFFNASKLRDFNNQPTQFNNPVSGWLPLPAAIVAASELKRDVGQVIFLLDAPPAKATILDLRHASTATESVLMVNQTHHGPFGGPMATLTLTDPPNQYRPEGWDPCDDKQADPHPEF